MKKVVLICNSCGRCCKYWNIPLDSADIQSLIKLGYIQNNFITVGVDTPYLKLVKGKCYFLDDKNLCKIHQEHGFKSKPEICKDFPLNEIVCGDFSYANKKHNKTKFGKSFYFRINNKLIDADVFIEMLKKLDISKPLIESYLQLLYNIINHEDRIIVKVFKIKTNEVRMSRKYKKELEDFIFLFSKSLFPGFNKRIGREIVFDFPARTVRVKIGAVDISIEHQKELLNYIIENFQMNKLYVLHPIKMLPVIYYYPYLSRGFSKGKEISFLDIIHAFSVLNSTYKFKVPGDQNVLINHYIHLNKILADNLEIVE